MVYTCVTCTVTFSEVQSQRLHFKTEWHRYNLKRIVSDLPPITDVSFQERFLSQHLVSVHSFTSQPALGSMVSDMYMEDHHNCTYCCKVFASRNAYEDHLRSKKHIDAVKKYVKRPLKQPVELPKTRKVDDTNNVYHDDLSDMDEEEDGWEDVDSEPLPFEECLFCSNISCSLEENLRHMSGAHSFYIPNAEYLIDLEGLIAYLAEKVGIGSLCLWCNNRGRAFQSSRAAKQHMVDKGHCKMLFEGSIALEEYSDFYDYSSSYLTCGDNPDGHNSKKRYPDDKVDTNILEDNGYELELPSGAVIGHRSLMRYYRQHLPPERPQGQRNRAVASFGSNYRAVGWTRKSGVATLGKARSIGFMNMKRSKQYMQLGIKANKLQKHFRDQVLF